MHAGLVLAVALDVFERRAAHVGLAIHHARFAGVAVILELDRHGEMMCVIDRRAYEATAVAATEHPVERTQRRGIEIVVDAEHVRVPGLRYERSNTRDDRLVHVAR